MIYIYIHIYIYIPIVVFFIIFNVTSPMFPSRHRTPFAYRRSREAEEPESGSPRPRLRKMLWTMTMFHR